MKPFSVSVILVKPSQRVVTSVSCDILGTTIKEPADVMRLSILVFVQLDLKFEQMSDLAHELPTSRFRVNTISLPSI